MSSTVGVAQHRAAPAPRSVRVPAAVRWCGRVRAWLVILGCLATLAVGLVIPRLAGATPYTILTGSMQPHYPPGTLVVDKKPDLDTIGVGTIVTYQLRSGDPTVVTHRVVAINTTLSGETTYTTQGDANPVPDVAPVKPVQIRGQFWYAVPYLGRVNAMASGHTRQLGVYAVGGALALYALGMFAGATRDRVRRRRS